MSAYFMRSVGNERSKPSRYATGRTSDLLQIDASCDALEEPVVVDIADGEEVQRELRW